ncbi:MAG: hypothetical protein HGA77_04730 [Chlorobiaceae bacterium]|nr:hypothetical protein [Chlorobiaceae bacterium]
MRERILLALGELFMRGFGGGHCGCNPGRRERFQMLIDEVMRDNIKKASCVVTHISPQRVA